MVFAHAQQPSVDVGFWLVGGPRGESAFQPDHWARRAIRSQRLSKLLHVGSFALNADRSFWRQQRAVGAGSRPRSSCKSQPGLANRHLINRPGLVLKRDSVLPQAGVSATLLRATGPSAVFGKHQDSFCQRQPPPRTITCSSRDRQC